MSAVCAVVFLKKADKKNQTRTPHLEVIRFVFIIQVNFLLKDGEWISDKEVCYVLGQQLVDSCTQRWFGLPFAIQTSSGAL